jgi:hypothetical protein
MKKVVAAIVFFLALFIFALPAVGQEAVNLYRIRQTIQTEVTIELEIDGQMVETTVPATITIDAEIDPDELVARPTVDAKTIQESVAVAAGSDETQDAEPTTVPSPTATPPPEQETVADFDSICGSKSGMTDVQVEAYYESLSGKHVIDWDGYVYDVHSMGGTYAILIANEPKGFWWSRQIELRGIPRNIAVQMDVEEHVRYSGTIQGAETFITSNCNPLIIGNVTIEAVD